MNNESFDREYEPVDTVCSSLMVGSLAVTAVLVLQALMG